MGDRRRILAGIAATVTVAAVTAGYATGGVPLKTKPPGFDGTAVAVAVIDAQMEQTRRQVVYYGIDDARRACSDAAWRPAMHHAAQVLEADPMLAVMARRWRTEWVDALVACWRGDMANANAHIAAAYEVRDALIITKGTKNG